MIRTKKIYGPPGTGKTHELLEILEREIALVGPMALGFLTFTRSARQEAQRRLGVHAEELPYLKTIHAICYRELNLERGSIVKIADLRAFGRYAGLGISGNPDPLAQEIYGRTWQAPRKGDVFLQLYHLMRHKQIPEKTVIQDAPTFITLHEFRWFVKTYEAWKRAKQVLDYTDLLSRYLEVGDPLPIKILIVDEAQDLSPLQWKVVRKMSASVERLYIAGDDDQAIFTWAGANARIFNEVEADEVKVLHQSYRLPRAVLHIADRIVKKISERYPKTFWARSAEGEIMTTGKLDAQLLDDLGDTLVLFRNGYRGNEIADDLEVEGFPYLGSRSVLDREDVRHAIAGWNNARRQRYVITEQIKALTRFGARDQWRNQDLAKAVPKLPNLSYVDRCVKARGVELTLAPRVRLMSIHQSKGREADNVVLLTEMARRTYEAMMKEPDDEHRVWYVGATRARERLVLPLATEERSYPLF